MSIPPLELLRCVACNADLRVEFEQITCVQCRAVYRKDDQAIFFVTEQKAHPVGDVDDVITVFLKNIFKRVPWLYRILIAVFGVSSGGVSSKRFIREHVPAEGIILNLGSGVGERVGHTIHVDLFAFPGVDVVADIAQLPFKDASVDAVMCMQVLEHIPDPDRIIAEIHRVVRPGGMIYLATPFMYPYHSSPKDYYRWTLDGLRRLAHGFDEKVAGVRNGPTSGLALMMAYWFATLFSFGSKRLFDAIVILGMILLAPVAHVFDLFLNRLKVAEASASGYYYIGKRSSDRPS